MHEIQRGYKYPWQRIAAPARSSRRCGPHWSPLPAAVPAPSCPLPLRPQAHTSPAWVRASVWKWPAARAATGSGRSTCCGTCGQRYNGQGHSTYHLRRNHIDNQQTCTCGDYAWCHSKRASACSKARARSPGQCAARCLLLPLRWL